MSQIRQFFFEKLKKPKLLKLQIILASKYGREDQQHTISRTEHLQSKKAGYVYGRYEAQKKLSNSWENLSENLIKLSVSMSSKFFRALLKVCNEQPKNFQYLSSRLHSRNASLTKKTFTKNRKKMRKMLNFFLKCSIRTNSSRQLFLVIWYKVNMKKKLTGIVCERC